MPQATEYSFEHGIDHCGREGIAPILGVGHRVTERDFIERDLSGIRGVSVSQHGLSKGTRWNDLNMSYLFTRLTGVEYLRILFDRIDLDEVGQLPALRDLEIDCPAVRNTLRGEMPHLHTARLRWSDACTAGLNAPQLQKLTLIRPRSEDLTIVSHLASLVELDIHYGRSLRSLSGVEALRSLKWLGLHDCANLSDLSTCGRVLGPEQLMIGGCRRFADATGAEQVTGLKKLFIYRGERGPREVRLPGVLMERGVELDLRGVTALWS